LADKEPAWLKVVGIEDVVAEQVRGWLMDRAPAGEPGLRIQALVGLGQEGVGGGFRFGYLQRRLAREAGGEVVIEWLSTGDHSGQAPAPRVMTLTACRLPSWAGVSGGPCRPILRYQRARGGRAVIQSRQTPTVTISRAGQGGLARARGTSCRLTRRCLRRPAHDERSDGFIARDGHDIAVYPIGGAIIGASVLSGLLGRGRR
jgi:hypothetical protein